jgi:hypothetical protein
MKRLMCGALLLVAQLLIAQQQGPPPYETPPYSTTPTFPQDLRPGEPLPPDTRAPAPGELSNPEIQQKIGEKLSTEPMLAGVNVNVSVDDKSVVLTGTVQDKQQHDLALRIAGSYADQREIVDKIQVQQKT